MLIEILYLSIVIVTGYQVQLLVRRGGPAQRTYAIMLGVDLALALVAFAARKAGEPSRLAETLGAVSIGGFVCLVMAPPALRSFARQALAAERVRLAIWLLDLRELLQPGLGAKQEKELVEAISDVREGRVDRALEALRTRRGAVSDPLVVRALDDRIVMTLLYARRWREAIDAYERSRDVDTLGSGHLLVEVVRAYGEAGELDKAALLMDRLERSPIAAEPAFAFLVARARMVFLSFVGRPADVDALLSSTGPLGMLPASARLYWIGTARLHAGDREGARQALGQALGAAGRDARAREITGERLAAVDVPVPELPRELSPQARDLAERVAGAARAQAAPGAGRALPRLDGVGPRVVPATLAIIALNVTVAIAVAWRLGSSEDPEVLVRAGANLRSAVAAGEWWRLTASCFLHMGLAHLVFNMYAVWALGKLMEQVLGTARFVVVYTIAGVAGALASYALGAAPLSVGASGAVFGLLGAAIAEFALRRKIYPERWRRSILGLLIFLTLAQLAIGMAYPIIDQAAHLGGLVGGAAVSALLAPGSTVGKTRAARWIAGALAALSVGSVAFAGIAVVTTPVARSEERAGWVRRELGGVSLEVPGLWLERGQGLADPTLPLSPALTANVIAVPETVADLETVAAGALDVVREGLKKEGDVRTLEEVKPSFTAERGWTARELRVAFDGADGRFFRHTIFVRRDGQEVLQLVTLFPEGRVDQMREKVSRFLTSAQKAGGKMDGRED